MLFLYCFLCGIRTHCGTRQCGKFIKFLLTYEVGMDPSPFYNWIRDLVCALGAHTSVHHSKQAHKAPTNDLGKMPNERFLWRWACGVLMNECMGITHGSCGWCMRGTWMTHKRRSAHRKGASKTCSWPTKRQWLTHEG